MLKVDAKAGQKIKYEIYNWADTTVDIDVTLQAYTMDGSVTWSD